MGGPLVPDTRVSAEEDPERAVAEDRQGSGGRLEALRRARGLSQEELARDAGVSTKTISRWANAQHEPSRITVRRVAQALSVSTYELTGEEPPELAADGQERLARVEQKLDQLLDRQEALMAIVVGQAPDRASRAWPAEPGPTTTGPEER